ncbi:glycosyltransferase, partial [Paracoccaceae bacterium]|nr:glycosyltransferase [Paracoccaceae bacterium]
MDIGITIPCFNSYRFLGETLASLRELKKAGCKINAVDSGSVDGTLELLKEYEIDTYFCPPGNMYKAVNIGLSHLNCEWLTYINSDDLLHAQNILEFLELNREALIDYDLFCGSIQHIDANGSEICCRRLFDTKLIELAVLNGQPILPQPGTFFRNRIYKELSGFDTHLKFSSDFDFFIRAFNENFNLLLVPDFQFASFRVHNDQFSNTQKAKLADETVKIIKKNNIKFKPFLYLYLRLLLFIK